MFATELLSHCYLLAQKRTEDWMDILFWVVIAAVWAIGGIVKAAGAKRKDRKRQPASQEQKPARQESFLERLAKKAEELQHAAELQSKQGARRPRQADSQGQKPRPAKPSQAAPGQVTVRTGRGGQPVLVYERQATSSTAQREQPRPPQPATPRSVRQHRRKPKPALVPTPHEASAVSPIDEDVPARRPPVPQPTIATRPGTSPLVDHGDAEALRRAILHLEILGKPMALRDPFE